jgi:hypothetical protein
MVHHWASSAFYLLGQAVGQDLGLLGHEDMRALQSFEMPRTTLLKKCPMPEDLNLQNEIS